MAAVAPAAAAVAAGRERAEGGGDVPSPPLPPPPRGQRADDTLDEVTRQELCTDTFCKVCGAVLQFESQRIAHYEGKRHAQKVRLYLQMHSDQKEGHETSKQKTQYVNFQMDPSVDENTYCRLCNMIFTSPIVAQSHYMGKIHTKKLKQLSGDQAQQATQCAQPEPGPSMPEPSAEKASQDIDAKDPPPSSRTTLDLDDPDKYCKLCSALFNNPLMAHQHYVGKKHKRNEARKKLMAEIGSEAIPVESKANAVGVGKYICPICSISLTSIEMYQSHMQGNKHQIKETIIVNLITNSKKTYNSFQDELEDYIKVQKARGLEPKTNFRKPEKDFQNEEYDAMNGHDRTFAFDRDQFSCDSNEPEQYSGFFSETCAPSYSVENRLSHWSPVYRDPLKLEHTSISQDSTECYLEKQVSPLATYKGDNYNPSSAESSDGYKSVSSDMKSYRRSQKLPKTPKRERECTREGKSNPRQPLVKLKRKQCSEEESGFGKDGEKKKKKKDEVDSAAVSKSKHSKDRGNKDGSSEKESRKRKKERKKHEASGPTEEELLWDESILGF
ncbi:zinc finger matrin-type protein 1-like [Rhineura floridana]|uniref:zinc finger matrin-type protein 1-like n=1 Tax=Rhineura floridana TaxID=261503 RepID=UPI002AC86C6B|nr:zinc finger matrin-type protein 1-like [Rhineura floridana]